MTTDRDILLLYISQTRPTLTQIKEFSDFIGVKSYASILRDLFIRGEIAIDTNQKVYMKEAKTAPVLPPLSPPYQWPKTTRKDWDDVVKDTTPRCPKCKLDISGPMGYVCGDPQCPTFIKVTL